MTSNAIKAIRRRIGNGSSMRNFKQKTGFTLLEALTASALSVVTAAIVMSLLVKNLAAWRDGMAQIHLTEQSRILRERLLHGVNGQLGLRHARRSQILVTNDLIVFFDAAYTNPLSLLWPSNQPPAYLDQSRLRPLTRGGVFAQDFSANLTGNFLELDFTLAAAGRNRVHTHPQRIRVYLLNE